MNMSGFQTALGGDALESSNFLSLFAVFMAVCTIMYLLVIGALLIGMWRGRTPGGELTVESAAGRGTRITVTLNDDER